MNEIIHRTGLGAIAKNKFIAVIKYTNQYGNYDNNNKGGYSLHDFSFDVLKIINKIHEG